MRALPGKAGKEEALNKILPWILIPSVFAADRVLKIWFIGNFDQGASVALWPGVFHLTRVENTGAAFGLWHNAAGALAFFSAASVLAIVVYMLGWFGPRAEGSQRYAWALVAGGALGNLYDRVTLGHVIDYLDFRIWPVFNFADVCISVGVAWIVWRYAAHSS